MTFSSFYFDEFDGTFCLGENEMHINFIYIQLLYDLKNIKVGLKGVLIVLANRTSGRKTVKWTFWDSQIYEHQGAKKKEIEKMHNFTQKVERDILWLWKKSCQRQKLSWVNVELIASRVWSCNNAFHHFNWKVLQITKIHKISKFKNKDINYIKIHVISKK